MSPRTSEQFEEIRKEKRDLILSAALKLFAHSSYHSVSISSIAKEAGISKGLMYNYFSSKEDLLVELINDYFAMMGKLINPDNDEEITNEEMQNFFYLLKESMKTNNGYWRLFYQLSIQKDVFEFITSKIYKGELYSKNEKLIYKFFKERFEEWELELFCFSSALKGFSIQYVFASDMFTDELIESFFSRLKSKYIVEKLNK